MITAKELIEKLKDVPGDTIVCVLGLEEGITDDIFLDRLVVKLNVPENEDCPCGEHEALMRYEKRDAENEGRRLLISNCDDADGYYVPW